MNAVFSRLIRYYDDLCFAAHQRYCLASAMAAALVLVDPGKHSYTTNMRCKLCIASTGHKKVACGAGCNKPVSTMILFHSTVWKGCNRWQEL